MRLTRKKKKSRKRNLWKRKIMSLEMMNQNQKKDK